jgi:hypothetical protein
MADFLCKEPPPKPSALTLPPDSRLPCIHIRDFALALRKDRSLPLPANWVCLYSRRHRGGRTLCLAGPDAGDWLCFAGALPACSSSQLLVGTALVLQVAPAPIGFVSHNSLHVRGTPAPDPPLPCSPAGSPNWVRLAQKCPVAWALAPVNAGMTEHLRRAFSVAADWLCFSTPVLRRVVHKLFAIKHFASHPLGPNWVCFARFTPSRRHRAPWPRVLSSPGRTRVE